MTDAIANSVAVQVRRANKFDDVSLSLTDHEVTVADVCAALGLGGQAVSIDGQLIATPAVTRAVEVLADGSRLSVNDHRTGRDSIAPSHSPGHDSENEASVEVAMVAGLDSGRTTRLGRGLFRIGASSEGQNSGWYLEVNNPDRRSSESRPWHHHAASIEAVPGPSCVVTLGKPVDAEQGYGKTVHRPPRALAPTAVAPVLAPVVPPQVKSPSALSWATLLAPIPIGLAMAFFFRPLFALFAAMGPVIALFRWYESRRRFRRETKRRRAQVLFLQSELERSVGAYAEERAQLRWLSQPSVAELWRRSRLRSVRLWERRPGSAGFLVASVGVGIDHEEAATDVDQLDSEVHALLHQPITLRSVPHVIDLNANRGVGIHGKRQGVLAVARSLILQLASMQGPADMRIGVLCEPSAIQDWDWVKWLPHLDTRFVATSGTVLAKRFTEAGESNTKANSMPFGRPDADQPVHVIIVDHTGADIAAVYRLAAEANSPLRVIAVAEHETLLPAQCSSLLAIRGTEVQIATPELTGRRSTAVAVGISTATATSWARSLTPLIDPEADDFVIHSDAKVSLLRLVDFSDVDELERRWSERSPDADPVAGVGVGDDGTFRVNLATDGPHVLIAGTTGSGKSEFLRTLVLGLAAECPPDHVNFVLVDFKGGGAFDAIHGLPHVAGLITDLDKSVVVRAISSLRAELHRRELLFRNLGVSTYTSAVLQSGEPIARVVIVIDEFAALATDYPELMTAVVDLAARGRSLGMHLVLATQRPSGVVDAKIRANTNMRIALRVQDGFDSQDVIGTQAAAFIDRKTPGRAIFSIGGEAPITVQTAFSGAPDSRARRCTVQPLALFEGPHTVIPHTVMPHTVTPHTVTPQSVAPKSVAPQSVTARIERDVLLEAILQAHDRRGCPVRPLWSEPLPEVLDWIDLGSRELTIGDAADTQVALGLVDLPSQQTQVPWYWDLASGPLAVYGASASCVGSALLAAGAALASAQGPEKLHLYVIDGDGGTTAPLQELRHTGAYVTLGEVDRIQRTIAFFENCLDRRRSGELAASKPRLVLLIDNIASILAVFGDVAGADVSERLAALARDGVPQGIHLVLGARTARDIGHRLAQHVPNRLALALADPAGYLSLGLRMNDVVPLPPMRAMDLKTTNVLQLVQPPDLSDWPPGAGIAAAERPKPIYAFPRSLDRSDLDPARRSGERLTIPVGVCADDLASADLEIAGGEHGLIVAGHGMGRSTALVTIARQLNAGELGLELKRVALLRSPLAAPGIPGDPMITADQVNELGSSSRRTVVLVDDADRLSADYCEAFERLLALVDSPVTVLAATSFDFARSMRSWTNPIRALGTGILLGGSHLDGDIFKTRLQQLDGLGHIAGRGHLVVRGQARGAQFAQP